MGLLATSNPASGVLTTVYTVPIGRRAAVTIAACNTGSTEAKVRIALSSNASPAIGEYIEYGSTLGEADVLERTAVILDAGSKVFVYATSAGIAFNVWGIEELA